MLKTIQQHIQSFAAISLAAGLPNQASVPHMIANGFKDILAIGLSADLKFKQLAAATSAQASAPAQTTGGAPAKTAAAPAPEEPKEEENVSMGGLFD